MKRIVLSSILVSCSLICSQSYAENSITQESSNEKVIEKTGAQEMVIEEIKVQENNTEDSPVEAKCREKTIQTISISNSSIESIDTDFNQIAESTKNKINKIAEELGLKDFDLNMTDQYANRNGYSTTTYDYSASLSMTFQFDKNAFGVFLKELSPVSISSSITKQECIE
ncbi:MAG: hypothetical protein P8179_02280 [Candidatus Thiodiazotropha sp.]|jgi:hypothetical protein